MKDIARLAGVSQGTVSNVINGRGNVSVEKIRKVEQAARDLGYVINAQAKQLRKDASLSANVAVILPNIDERMYISFFRGAKLQLEEKGYAVLLFLTNHSPYRERQIVRQAAELRVSGVITATCCLSEPDLYRPITASGGRVVHALQETDNAVAYVGFDYGAIGRKIAAYLVENGHKTAGLLTGPEHSPGNHSLIVGLQEQLSQHGIPLQVVHANAASSAIAPFEFFSADRSPDVVVLSNSGHLNYVQLAASVGSFRPCPPIVILAQDAVTETSAGIVRFALDFVRAGQRAAELITRKEDLRPDSAAVNRIILEPRGFRDQFSQQPQAPAIHSGTPLRVLMPKGVSTNALIRMTPSFTRLTGIPVEYVVKEVPQDAWDAVQTMNAGDLDVSRSSMPRLSLFPDELFRTFTHEEFHKITAGMIHRIVKDFSLIGGKLRAIPFDMGVGILIYRKDLFEDSVLKRMFYESNGIGLGVPRSFEDFVKVVRFFDRRSNPQSPVPYGTSLNLESASELGSHLLLRYLNYTRDLDFRKGYSRPDPQALRRCVDNFNELGRYAMPVREGVWIGSALDQFIQGKTAMEIVFLNYAANIINLQNITQGGQVGYATVPGGNTYITGGSFCVLARSKQPEAAKLFIEWACGKKQAELFTLLGGISPHRHVYDSTDIITRYPGYRQLPEIVDAACGRDLFDTISSSGLEQRAAPLIRELLNGRIDASACSSRMVSAFEACFFQHGKVR